METMEWSAKGEEGEQEQGHEVPSVLAARLSCESVARASCVGGLLLLALTSVLLNHSMTEWKEKRDVKSRRGDSSSSHFIVVWLWQQSYIEQKLK